VKENWQIARAAKKEENTLISDNNIASRTLEGHRGRTDASLREVSQKLQ